SAEGHTTAKKHMTGDRASAKGTTLVVPQEPVENGALALEALVREETLRSATRASKTILAGMVRKKWIAREDLSAAQDAKRTVKIALLKSAEGKLNENQRTLIDSLIAA